MRETFRKAHWWTGIIQSSLGYSVYLRNGLSIRYEDEFGVLLLDADAMTERPVVTVAVESAPDRPERSRREVLVRIQRALEWDGTKVHLQYEDGTYLSPTDEPRSSGRDPQSWDGSSGE